MSLEEYLSEPQTYNKLMNLIELMSRRNLIIDILNGLQLQKLVSDISDEEFDILNQKFYAKLSIIDKELNRVSINLICLACKNKIVPGDNVVACLNCGMPFHMEHFINSIKDLSYCPACGEFFEIIINDDENLVYFDQKITKTSRAALKKEFPILVFKFRGKIILKSKEDLKDKLICPECGEKINQNWVFCKYCGAKIKDVATPKPEKEVQKLHSYIKCPRCGNHVRPNWKHCKWCGAKLV
ncbi:MAG: zinc ribbon domain-containing protein [Candidatus Helarchaeota archaeon]